MHLLFSLGICLGLLGSYKVYGQYLQAHHVNHTQNATVLCTLNGTTYCLMFDLWANADNIDLVFTRDHNDSTINSYGTFDSNGTGIAVDTSLGFEQFWLSIYWTNGGAVTFLQSGVDALAYTEGPEIVSVDVMAKSLWHPALQDMLTHAADVVWKASCNMSEIQDQIVTSGIVSVSGDVEEHPDVVTSSATLFVVHSSSNSPFPFVFSIGESMYLQVVIDSQPGSSVVALGVYVFDLWVCEDLDCIGVNKKRLIHPNGCPVVPNFVGQFFTQISFAPNSITASFPAFQLNGAASYYFQAKVGFCYTALDARCTDYCTFNGKRKRRQAGPEEEDPLERKKTIVTKITVRTSGSGVDIDVDSPAIDVIPHNNAATPDETIRTVEIQSVGLIAAVVTLAGLLLVGLIIAAAVFFRITNRNRGNEKTMT